ncbi:hypothetical protein BT63DRAFT_175771 [Microthyrium microscopicum]|uniref:Uncharacterized protein n=1 Tax=Microthyrium microscopicum TaxID=703497 RepID=A0A6A6UJB6_9PEZI|nr:hypothetical protein BT63DRAFT_175771 [Microthyrium microscopicum]
MAWTWSAPRGMTGQKAPPRTGPYRRIQTEPNAQPGSAGVDAVRVADKSNAKSTQIINTSVPPQSSANSRKRKKSESNDDSTKQPPAKKASSIPELAIPTRSSRRLLSLDPGEADILVNNNALSARPQPEDQAIQSAEETITPNRRSRRLASLNPVDAGSSSVPNNTPSLSPYIVSLSMLAHNISVRGASTSATASPSTDSILPRLAQMAQNDSALQQLMKLVAKHEATPEQAAQFQRRIDRLKSQMRTVSRGRAADDTMAASLRGIQEFVSNEATELVGPRTRGSLTISFNAKGQGKLQISNTAKNIAPQVTTRGGSRPPKISPRDAGVVVDVVNTTTQHGHLSEHSHLSSTLPDSQPTRTPQLFPEEINLDSIAPEEFSSPYTPAQPDKEPPELLIAFHRAINHIQTRPNDTIDEPEQSLSGTRTQPSLIHSSKAKEAKQLPDTEAKNSSQTVRKATKLQPNSLLKQALLKTTQELREMAAEEESTPVEEESMPVEEESMPVEEESMPVEEELAAAEKDSTPVEEELAAVEEEPNQSVAAVADSPPDKFGPDGFIYSGDRQRLLAHILRLQGHGDLVAQGPLAIVEVVEDFYYKMFIEEFPEVAHRFDQSGSKPIRLAQTATNQLENGKSNSESSVAEAPSGNRDSSLSEEADVLSIEAAETLQEEVASRARAEGYTLRERKDLKTPMKYRNDNDRTFYPSTLRSNLHHQIQSYTERHAGNSYPRNPVIEQIAAIGLEKHKSVADLQAEEAAERTKGSSTTAVNSTREQTPEGPRHVYDVTTTIRSIHVYKVI